MPAFSRGEVELLLKVLGVQEASRDIDTLKKKIATLGTASRPKGQQSGIGKFLFGVSIGQAKQMLVTLGSALRRTFAYGLVNVFRDSLRNLILTIKEAATTSLALGRSAAIMAAEMQQISSVGDVYDNLLMSIIKVKDTTFLLSKELAKVNFVLTIAGVRGEAAAKALSLIDKMAAITGEDANKLTMDFIRLTNAFQIGEDEWGQAADSLVAGITNAVMLMPDMLNAVKMLGTTWVLAFGGGLEQLHKFNAAVAALSQVGLKGGMGARYLNRFILGLVAPTKQAAALLSVMGVNMYKATGQALTHAYALQTTARQTREHNRELMRLHTIRAGMIRSGSDLAGINKRIDETQQKANAGMEQAGELWQNMITKGAKLKDVDEILKEFAKVMKKGEISGGKLFQIFKELFQMRGMRAVALVNNVEEFLRLLDATQNSAGTVEKIMKGLTNVWGMNLKEATSAFSKIRNLLVEIFAGPVVGEIARSVDENIIKPLIDAFTKNDTWKTIREDIKKNMGTIFDDVTTKIGTFLKIMIVPDSEGLTRGSDEWKAAMDEAYGDMMKDFQPMFDKIKEAFWTVGKLAGEAFMAGMGEAIGKMWDEALANEMSFENIKNKFLFGANPGAVIGQQVAESEQGQKIAEGIIKGIQNQISKFVNNTSNKITGDSGLGNDGPMSFDSDRLKTGQDRVTNALKEGTAAVTDSIFIIAGSAEENARKMEQMKRELAGKSRGAETP